MRRLCFVLIPALLATLATAEEIDQPRVDNRTIDLPTHKAIPPLTFQVVFTHRFSQPVDDGGFDELWGLDSSADIGIGLGMGLWPGFEVEVYRSSLFQQWELSGKWAAVRQGGDLPVSLALRLGAGYRGADGVEVEWTGFAQAVVSRRVGEDLDLYVVPMVATDTPSLENAFNVGLGASWHFAESWDLEVELIPANDDANPSYPLEASDAEASWSVALNKRIGGHAFLIYLGNSRATTVDLLVGSDLPGGFDTSDVRLGFNITRRFPG